MDTDGITQVWSLNSRDLKSLESEYEFADAKIMGFSQDGNKFIVASDGISPLAVWSKDGRLLKKFNNAYKNITKAKFILNDKIIISGGAEGIKIWRKDGRLIRKIKLFEEPDFVYQTPIVDFSNDGKIAVINHENINIWNQYGKLQKIIKGDDAPNSISFSPDGKIIASISSLGIRMYNQNGKLLKNIEDSGDLIYFSPDGSIIASTNRRMIKTWSRDGKLLGKGYSQGLITSISFSSKSNIIASSDDEGIIKIWNKKCQEIQTLKTSSSIGNINFNPDGKTLIYSGEKVISMAPFFYVGEKVILLNFELDDLLKKGCDWLHDYLTTNPNVSAENKRLCNGIKR
ncbi:hypothetical protein H6G64_33175 [Calothrix sp. FACHB-156]|nr:hypothetical protein [Calothrix sp. FACHB-156]